MNNIHISRHPIAADALSTLRDAQSDIIRFREAIGRISRVLCIEATRDLPLMPRAINTPIESTESAGIAGEVILVPILRAGLGMVEAFLQLLPHAHVGHIGLYRDEASLQPVQYYSKYPENMEQATVILLDPMLATGGSASAALGILKERGAVDLRLVSLLCAPEGVHRLAAEHPGVPVYTAALDRQLNDRGYIMPGLGDAGDRMFGTD